MAMVDYWNTNRESGTVLRESRAQSRYQQILVLEFFVTYPHTLFTPEEVHTAVLAGSGAPLTSTRRAITNLTTMRYLVKTEVMGVGGYGKQVHQWRLNLNGDSDNEGGW